MGEYRTAEICPNGHVSTGSANVYPDLREKFCSKCGEATITQCPKCNASIRGDYREEGVRLIRLRKPRPYCFNCGTSFPWTERKIEAAVERVQEGGKLSGEELSQFRDDLGDLVKDSSRVAVASLRFKKFMGKIGAKGAGAVRDIVVDVLSEAAKKAIWGS